MLTFKTREEAEKLLQEQELKGSGLDHFCPLIKDRCRRDCISFVSSRITESKLPKEFLFHLYDPYCANPLITGEFYTNG